MASDRTSPTALASTASAAYYQQRLVVHAFPLPLHFPPTPLLSFSLYPGDLQPCVHSSPLIYLLSLSLLPASLHFPPARQGRNRTHHHRHSPYYGGESRSDTTRVPCVLLLPVAAVAFALRPEPEKGE